VARSISTLPCLYLVLGLSTAAFSQTPPEQPSDRPALKYHAPSEASDPGKVSLSLPRLFRLEPALAPKATQEATGDPATPPLISEEQRMKVIEMLKEHMEAGDSRAAVVISIKPLLVAAYSDELDCVAMLQFQEWLVREHKLKSGTRLLTVNTYTARTKAIALQHGPKDLKRYRNIYPIIAEFVTDDQNRVRQRKAQIAEEEWQRCVTLGKEYRDRFPSVSRNGSPARSMIPSKLPAPAPVE
jgi:hypothetical protein